MSLLYGKLNKELKLLGSVQAQLHTHVNMFICKPLDYIMAGSEAVSRRVLILWQVSEALSRRVLILWQVSEALSRRVLIL